MVRPVAVVALAVPSIVRLPLTVETLVKVLTPLPPRTRFS